MSQSPKRPLNANANATTDAMSDTIPDTATKAATSQSDKNKDKTTTKTKAAAKLPVFWIAILGMIMAIGPLSIDMYLPALPTMADDFGVSTAFIANSLPAYFIGLVFGQLFYGPLSDRVGRLKPLYFGMALYVIASILCATTSSEYILFAGRTLQALGACVGTVVTRAAIRDALPPKQTAKAFSIIMLVMGVAPILAPSLGTLMLKFFDWHAIFWFFAAYGVLNLILTKLFFHETLAPEDRNVRPINTVLSQYWDLLKDPTFGYPAIGAGLMMGSMFVYISAAPELLMDGYHLSETTFSIVFGTNAGGFIALTQINQLIANRFRLVSILRFGAIMQVIASLSLMTLGLFFGLEAWLPLVLISIFFSIAGLGFTQPNASAISLAFQKHRSGMASALQGSLTFCVGIFGGLMLNLFPVNQVLKLGISMSMLMCIGAFLIFQVEKNLNLDNVD